MKLDQDFIDGYVKGIFRPGAVLVSYGMRGGGKTHCAVSFCQRLMENAYPGTPKHVVLVTNVIFVKRVGDSGTDADLVKESPPGVHMIRSMREIFPIVVDTLERYGRRDTMVILLLDEAQNFLLGDMNNVGDMAAAMKKFCGIIRKFNLCLWLISPAMRNLGPAFRNFLDADTDPGNVNCTFQKDTAKAQRFIDRRHYSMDPRSIVYVKPGFTEPTQLLPVPTSDWTRDPETLPVGGYAYDNLASADFTVGDFPFHEFVQHISGKSSYEMVQGIREFYGSHPPVEEGAEPSAPDGRMTEAEFVARYYQRFVDAGVMRKTLCEVFGRDAKTLRKWAREGAAAQPDEGGGRRGAGSPPSPPAPSDGRE